MALEIEEPVRKTAASLMVGIVGDLQRLVEQQVQLTRREVEEELRLRATSSAVIAFGMAVLFLAAILLCQAAVHYMYELTNPMAAASGGLSLGSCHAVLAAILGVVGAIIAIIGRAQFIAVGRAPNPATEILKRQNR
jgi:hypothetical protein